MIVDSSALVAILFGESDAAALSRVLMDEVRVRVSTATVLETALVVSPALGAELDNVIAELGLEVAPFDTEQLAAARTAMEIYGKGRGSRAQLNYGDCMSYALAKVTGEPLLFTGDDFTHTDITSAL